MLLAEIVNADWRVPHQIVLDDDYVYWTDRDYPPDPGLIQRVRKAGGIPEPLATAEGPRELAISSRGLFWIEEPTFDAPIITMFDWSDLDAAPRSIANAPDVVMLAAIDDTVVGKRTWCRRRELHRCQMKWTPSFRPKAGWCKRDVCSDSRSSRNTS